MPYTIGQRVLVQFPWGSEYARVVELISQRVIKVETRNARYSIPTHFVRPAEAA